MATSKFNAQVIPQSKITTIFELMMEDPIEEWVQGSLVDNARLDDRGGGNKSLTTGFHAL